jgi:hypothetical protein
MVKYGTFSAMLNDSFTYKDLETPIVSDVQPRENLNVLGKSSILFSIRSFLFLN